MNNNNGEGKLRRAERMKIPRQEMHALEASARSHSFEAQHITT